MNHLCRILFCFIFTVSFTPLMGEVMSAKQGRKQLKANKVRNIRRANQLLNEGAVEEALALYEKVLDAPGRCDENTVYQTATLYYLVKNYQAVIQLLEKHPIEGTIPESQFLVALAYKHENKIQKAVKNFKLYLEGEGAKKPDALYQIAHLLFKSGNGSQAKQYLKRLYQESSELKTQVKAKLYLARISLSEGNPWEAEKILSSLPKKGKFSAEYAYLMGKVQFSYGEFEKAKEHFSISLQNCKDKKKPAWISELYEYSVQCQLLLMESRKTSLLDSFATLVSLEPLIVEQAKITGLEGSYLSLAHYFTVCHKCIGDPCGEKLANMLLSDADESTQSLYLQGLISPTYIQRKRAFEKLAATEKNCPFRDISWYFRGLNDYHEGKKTKSKQILNEAYQAFQFAVTQTITSQPHIASLAFKGQIHALLAHKSYDHTKIAYEKIERAREINPNLIENSPVRDQILYLQGLAAYELSKIENSVSMKEAAMRSWDSILTYTDNSSLIPEIWFSKGTIYYDQGDWALAEKEFLQVFANYPETEKAVESLYMAALCQEKQQKDEQPVKKMLFETYPDSPLAGLAYLTYYSRSDYLKGGEIPLSHLNSLPEKFPNSPYSIEAYYLIGLDKMRPRYTSSGTLLRNKDLASSIHHFQQAEEKFDEFLKKGSLQEPHLSYFATVRYESSLERALSYLAIGEESSGTKQQIYFEYAKDLLEKVALDLEKNEEEHIQILTKSDPYPPMLEECHFELATTFVKMGDDKKAEQILHKMKERFKQAKITRGLYMARMHVELGLLASKKGDFSKAIHHFKKAEDASQGKTLASDEKLNIWIQESQCYLNLDDTETAMRLLSKVINYDIASSERLKAMYLRSEIYEKQNRHELAKLQLEALAKQQGEWAKKAKKRLKQYEEF